MYIFAIVTLTALGVVALVKCMERFIDQVKEYRPMAMATFGLLAAWLADFDLFARYGVAVREHWIGVALTGLALGGVALVWHEVHDTIAGWSRKTNDEAAALEKSQGLKAA